MFKVFLLAGQSNMAGAGTTAELPVHVTCPDNVRLFQDGEWRELCWRETFGPEVGMAQLLGEAFPDDRIVLCKVAMGGANLYYDWNPDGVSQGPEDNYRGPLYPKLIKAIEVLKEKLASEDDAFEFSGFFWMQGERDSVFEFMAEAYQASLTDLLDAVRRDTGTPDLPVVLGQIAPRKYVLEEGRFQHAWRHIVQEAQRMTTASDPRVGLVETMDLPQSDNLHFDTAGQLELGKRMAQVFLQKA